MNLIALMSDATEVVAQESQISPTVIAKFVILIVIVAGICVYFILKPSDARKKLAEEYLTKLATDVMNIAFANLDIEIASNIMESTIAFKYEEFRKAVIEAIKKDSWDFVQSSIKYSITHDKLDPLAARLISEDSVNKLVDLVLGRADMQTSMRNAYETLTNKVLKEMEEEEAKAKQLADMAEAQPEEPSDPVDDSVVECFTDNTNSDIDDSVVLEPISKDDPDLQLEIDDDDILDDDNNPNTVG